MKKVEVIKGEGLLGGGRNGIEVNLKRVVAYCRVSTDSEDQLQSYHSQVKYYTELINENSDWTMAGVYADEAITGTQIDKRLDFQRLINDCMNGDIDMIITKSISRFARNTLDTLKYVRQLKEMNVAVFFEKESTSRESAVESIAAIAPVKNKAASAGWNILRKTAGVTISGSSSPVGPKIAKPRRPINGAPI